MTLEQIIERAKTAQREEGDALRLVRFATDHVKLAHDALARVEKKETHSPMFALEGVLANLYDARGKILTLMEKGPKCDRCASPRGLKTTGRSGAVLCEDCRQ